MRHKWLGGLLLVVAAGCEAQVAVQSPPPAASGPVVETQPVVNSTASPTANFPATPAAPAPASHAADTESISLQFVELTSNPRGEFVVLRFTNQTSKTIAELYGSVMVYDADGHLLRGYGYTDQLFNYAAGHSEDLPLLPLHPDRPMAAHRDHLDELRYEFVAKKIVFAD